MCGLLLNGIFFFFGGGGGGGSCLVCFFVCVFVCVSVVFGACLMYIYWGRGAKQSVDCKPTR